MSTPLNMYGTRDELQFGPHGTYPIGRLSKGRRKRAAVLRDEMQALNEASERVDALADDETLRTDEEQRTLAADRAAADRALTGLLDSLRRRTAELAATAQAPAPSIDDIEDATAYMLCELVTVLVHNAPLALPLRLYDDYANDLLGIDDITASVEYIEATIKLRGDEGN